MFFKNLMNQFGKTEIDRSFWKYYQALVDLYTIKNGERSLHIRKGIVTICEEKNDQFKYRLHVRSRENKEDSYYFPVVPDLKPKLFFNPQDRFISYEFYIEAKLQIQIIFRIKAEGYEDVGQFREILARLLYQTIYKN